LLAVINVKEASVYQPANGDIMHVK